MPDKEPLPQIPEQLNAIAIGGGKLDTESPDLLDRGIELSGVEGRPNVLMIPTAKGTKSAHESYVDRIGRHFMGVGTDFNVLHPFLLDETKKDSNGNMPVNLSLLPSEEELAEMFGNADVIFTAGGNTRKMLQDVWVPREIDKLLHQKIMEGTPIEGISAGAIKMFMGGHSDWQSYETNKPYDPAIPTGHADLSKGWNYDYVEGLGYIPTTSIPHYDTNTEGGEAREDSSHRMIAERFSQGIKEKVIGIDNNAALEITKGGMARAIQGEGSSIADVRKGVFVLEQTEDGLQRVQREPNAEPIPFEDFVSLNT